MAKEDKLSKEERVEVRKEIKKDARERAITHAIALKNEYKKQVSTALITAFGLVVALAWKDVVTAIIPTIAAPNLLERFPLLVSLYTAIVITVFSVLGIVIISQWGKSIKED